MNWRVLLMRMAIGLAGVGFVVGGVYVYRMIQSYQILQVREEADPLREFQRTLPLVARGELTNPKELADFEELVANDAGIRAWMVERFPVERYAEQFTMMALVSRLADRGQTFREFAALLDHAMRNDAVAGAACKTLIHYDIPQRKELIAKYIDVPNGSKKRFMTQIATRTYLDIYGAHGIEESVERHLASNAVGFRFAFAGLVALHADGRLAANAMDIFIGMYDGGFRNCVAVLSVFEKFNRHGFCGDLRVLEVAHQQSTASCKPEHLESVIAYIERCGDG